MVRIQIFFLLSPVWLMLFTACGTDTEMPKDANNFMFAENNGGITLPEGFRAVVVAENTGNARHLAVENDGDIYVALRQAYNGFGIAALRDTNGDGIADTTAYFGDYAGTGIALYNNYLYFGLNSGVIRYAMTAADLVPPAEPEIIAGGFPDQIEHIPKSITIDNEGGLYVNVGADSNTCQEQVRTPGSPGQDPCPQLDRHAGIWKFDANKTGQTQQDDGERYATGIRNAVAIEWNTGANKLYLVQHGRDQLSALWPDYYDIEENAELPSEEFFKVNKSDNFGWPYTYYDHQRGEKMMNPEYGGDGDTPAPEGEFENPILAFPGHWAPNDLVFYSGNQFPAEYINGAFIAFHGSWNRAPLPQQGYKVVFVPFDGPDPATGNYRVFADGFTGTEVLLTRDDAEYRPMGLAQGPDGSLYIADSKKGKLWRVIYTGH